MRARGWRDRFFRVPHAFYEARFRPREAWYGAPSEAFDLPGDVTVWEVPAFPPGFLEEAGGVWMRVLATTVLSAEERATFAALAGPDKAGGGKRRRDWITGRVAIKEAARAWVADTQGVLCLPADVVVRVDAQGKPFVDLSALGLTAPQVSLSHAGGAAVAVAAGQAAGIDMEFAGAADPALLTEGGFGPDERALLTETDAALAGWCAKEAAAKALGQGLTGRPKAFGLTTLGQTRAQVRMPDGRILDVALSRDDGRVLALALL